MGGGGGGSGAGPGFSTMDEKTAQEIFSRFFGGGGGPGGFSFAFGGGGDDDDDASMGGMGGMGGLGGLFGGALCFVGPSVSLSRFLSRFASILTLFLCLCRPWWYGRHARRQSRARSRTRARPDARDGHAKRARSQHERRR